MVEGPRWKYKEPLLQRRQNFENLEFLGEGVEGQRSVTGVRVVTLINVDTQGQKGFRAGYSMS